MKRHLLITAAIALLLTTAPARLRSLPISASSGEARRPASAKASAVRRSFSEGGSAFGAKAAAQSSRSRLAHLGGVEELKSWFNAGQGHPRLILLLSPT